MATQRTNSPPLTVEQALQELQGAGDVAGLAQQAMLDHVSGIAAAKNVRLQREVARLTKKYGKTAPQTQTAADRLDQHAVFVSAVKAEQERSAVPIPQADPKAAIVYGRVMGSDGPVAGVVVEAIASGTTAAAGAAGAPADTSHGTVTSDTKGVYQLSLPILSATVVVLRVRDPQKQTVLAESSPLMLQPGMRAYREIVVPPPSDSTTAPPSEGPPSSTGTAITVPDLKGMTGEEATVTLNRVGLTVGVITGQQVNGRVAAQKPAAGEKVASGTPVDLVFQKG